MKKRFISAFGFWIFGFKFGDKCRKFFAGKCRLALSAKSFFEVLFMFAYFFTYYLFTFLYISTMYRCFFCRYFYIKNTPHSMFTTKQIKLRNIKTSGSKFPSVD